MNIDEIYLDSAVRIKRTYMNLMSQLEDYEGYMKNTLEIINETMSKLDKISGDIKDPKKRRTMEEKTVMMELHKIMESLENDAKRMEDKINPINEKIESLSVEESELWRSMKNRYPAMQDGDIVQQVSKRLEKEGLL